MNKSDFLLKNLLKKKVQKKSSKKSIENFDQKF